MHLSFPLPSPVPFHSTCIPCYPQPHSLPSDQKGPTGPHHRSVSWQVGCLSPSQSSLMPRSSSLFCCRSSSVRLGLDLSTEARSWQQPDVRLQLTSLQGRHIGAPSQALSSGYLGSGFPF